MRPPKLWPEKLFEQQHPGEPVPEEFRTTWREFFRAAGDLAEATVAATAIGGAVLAVLFLYGWKVFTG
jgi:hypothetical protein